MRQSRCSTGTKTYGNEVKSQTLFSKTKTLLVAATVSLPLLLSACLGGGNGGSGDPNVDPGGGNPTAGDGGSLTLTGTPNSTNGTFVPDKLGAGSTVGTIGWVESVSNKDIQHMEILNLIFNPPGQLLGIQFRSNDFAPSVSLQTWICADDCVGITVDEGAGKVVFADTVLTLSDGNSAAQSIMLNGTLYFSATSGAAPDVTPPTVSTVSPAKDATDVALSSAISATFSEPMLASSIDTTTFVVGGVTGTVTYSGNTATFTPAANLSPNTTYSAMITTGAKDAAGNALAAAYTWNFVTGTATSGTSTPKGNNGALLTGAAIGSGSTAVSELRKSLAVNGPSSSTSDWKVGAAYATRSAANSNAAYIVVPITNIGTTVRCFVRIDGLTYRDGADTVLVGGKFTYARGSVRNIASEVSTSTCIGPGETGMIADIQTNLYATVAKMEFSVAGTSGSSAPAASVIPQSYTVQTDQGGNSKLQISVKNVGTGAAKIGGGFHFWYLVDDTGAPQFWGISQQVSAGVVPVSGAGTISPMITYSGSSNSLLVLTEFGDTNQTAVAARFEASQTDNVDACSMLLPDELAMCLLESQDRQAAMLEGLVR